MVKILVTNDDSYLSKGLYLLYEAVKDLGEVRIYSTMWPRSAVGHAVTFNKPVRLDLVTYMGYEVYVTDGSPVDALNLALAVHNFKPDVVLSGVNVGENLTMQHILYSGTLAVAAEAALLGIPAIAFSADVRMFDEFDDPLLSQVVKVVARTLTKIVVEVGLPKGVDLLSVNIPSPSNLRKCVRLTRAARRRWLPAYERRLDTRGRPYYWLYTMNLPPEPGTDVYAVYVEGCVSVTPLRADMNVVNVEGEELVEMVSCVERELKKAL